LSDALKGKPNPSNWQWCDWTDIRYAGHVISSTFIYTPFAGTKPSPSCPSAIRKKIGCLVLSSKDTFWMQHHVDQ